VTADFSISIFTLSATFNITVVSFTFAINPWMPAFVTTLSPVSTGNQELLLLLPFLLRPKHHEIHDDENENEGDEKPDAAGGTRSGSRGLCLS